MSLAGFKIKDGLFVGDADNAADLDSILACKLTRVINCCGTEVPNHWESTGIKYLKYDWEDVGSQVVLDKQDEVANATYEFIEDALSRQEGVLVHSFSGESRSCCICAAYLMRRYSWSLNKTLEYLRSCHLGKDIKMGLLHQLQAYERRLGTANKGALARDWSGAVGSDGGDESLVRNTFVNVRETTGIGPDGWTALPPATLRQGATALRWRDTAAGGELEEAKEPEEPEEPKSPLSAMLSSSSAPKRPVPPAPPRDALPARSALKGARSAAGAADDATAGAGAAVAIQTRTGLVRVKPSEIVSKRFGLNFRGSRLILEYEVPTRGLLAHHPMKVHLMTRGDDTGACDKATAQRLQADHAPWLGSVSTDQLVELVSRLRLQRSAVGGS